MKAGRHLILIFLATLLSGCVGDKAEYVHSVWTAPNAAELTQKVYYVTDREADPAWPGGFAKHWADKLSCGTAQALIPPLNKTDEKTGRLGTLARQDCGTQTQAIAASIAAEARVKGCNEVLLYVHGFNTLIDGAILRAGQLALDTKANCAVAAFSWASEGEVGRYVADIEHGSYAAPELETLLRALAKQGLSVDVVGHSIGARLTLMALSSLAQHDDPPEAFLGQLILAAADVGADPVNNDFAHLVADARPFVHRITVYASRGDAVLAVSGVAHGNVPRAGRRTKGDRALEDGRIDVVDASDAPAELLGHSYFALSTEMIGDIALVLRGMPAAERTAPDGDRPATLTVTPEADAPPHYVLAVTPARRPDAWVKLIRDLAPLVPRIELAPLTGSPE
ncbi:MAG: alpha/beta hydrolase [Alphaproteobacteria bacterium]|nr:alpha/beta hydrolase [Alphaproteobacteria bacterium]